MLQILKTYYQFILKYRLRYAGFIAVLLVAIGLESLQPYFYKLFVDAILGGDLYNIWFILITLIGVRLVSLVFDIISRWLADWVIIPAARDIRVAVFKKIQALDFAFHLSKSTGSLISAFKRGDTAVFSIHHIIDISMAQIAIQFIVMLFFLSQVHLFTMFAMIIAVGVNLFATVFLIKYNMKTRAVFNEAEDNLSAVITDNMLNFETVKLFAKENAELSRLKHTFIDWSAKLWSFALSYRLIDGVVGIIGNISFAIVMSIGVLQLQKGNISAGDFVMILGFISNFYYQFYQLTFRLKDLAKFMTDIEKYLYILALNESVKDPAKPVAKTTTQGNIIFDNVSFQYKDGKDALNNFNLRIKPGQTVALVGHSGAGKSTVVKLLLRFFDPDSGTVSIDNVPITDITKSQLRSLIGVVPQEPILFNSTIRENICYGVNDLYNQTKDGKKTVSEKELIAAAKMAHAHEFISELPDGYETLVGERGIKLSGGQKQRLAIARMILSNPDIVVFDEATSQLDSESEKKIQDAFWKVTEDKTTLIIAHRLSTVVKADKIIVMDQGKIVEIGSHRELLRQNKKYASFWKLQTVG
jgi:ATP-binding cassette subfamily B protein